MDGNEDNCYDRAQAIDPRIAARAWFNKGTALAALGRHDEALDCCNKALAIDLRFISAWSNKAILEDALGWRREAALSYRKFIEIATPQYAQRIAHARKRLQELEEGQLPKGQS
ncbi:MAG: tetratricopeptide repeat protein [Limisphaerales bacterium]